nr:SDR family oxidoreductase [Nocardia sp. 852002-20019_SCH5090214]
MPLGRLGQPTEIADAVVFLASPQARFITGIELFIDGGETQVWPKSRLPPARPRTRQSALRTGRPPDPRTGRFAE